MTFRTEGLRPRERKRRKKWIYIGAPASFALEQCCQQIWDAFCDDARFGGVYGVGSAYEREDWRDVDVRCILDDEAFAKLFPAVEGETWEHDPRWLLLTVSISQWMSKLTGLPIDFQFQPMTHANKRHHTRRHPLGLRFARKAARGAP